jgi:hypothetical protein
MIASYACQESSLSQGEREFFKFLPLWLFRFSFWM